MYPMMVSRDCIPANNSLNVAGNEGWKSGDLRRDIVDLPLKAFKGGK